MSKIIGKGISVKNAYAADRQMLAKMFQYYSNDQVTQITTQMFSQNADIISLSFENCSIIQSIAFYSCFNLKEIILPNCSSIAGYQTFYAPRLERLELPKCEIISSVYRTFYKCLNLSELYLPECKYIYGSAGNTLFDAGTEPHHLRIISIPKLQVCSAALGLSSDFFPFVSILSFPLLESAPASFCYNAHHIQEVYLDTCSNLADFAFTGCWSLSVLNLPRCTTFGNYTIANCSKLSIMNLPACSNLGTRTFTGCRNLTMVNLPVCQQILDSCFNECYNLLSVYLLSDSVCTLGSSCFISCYSLMYYPNGGIYVPSDLLSSYKTATNWVSMSAYIKAVSA